VDDAPIRHFEETMGSRATGDTFFTASGSSPPSDGGQALKSNDVAALEGQALPVPSI
jgi:hypothetical protein